jgi:hypothetical protein
MTINDKKLTLFVIITFMFILTLTLPKINYYILTPMYIGFVLVGLYDIGKDIPD